MRNIYYISYDLIREKDYSALIDAIKKIGPWWHQTRSGWMVVADSTSVQLRNHLKTFMDNDDKLFIVRINSQDWAGAGFTSAEYQWLRDRMSELNITSF
jgi:hypothetical protein